MKSKSVFWITDTLENLDYYSGYDYVKKDMAQFNNGEEFNIDTLMNFDDIRFEKLVSNDGDSAVLYGIKMLHTWRFFIRRQGELEGPFTAKGAMENLNSLWHFSSMLKYIAMEVMHDRKTVIDSDRIDHNGNGYYSRDCHFGDKKKSQNH